jgi:hypothetical protein
MESIMSREIANKPHPTPNPDGPHTGGSNRESGAGDGSPVQPGDEVVTEEPQDLSSLDDLNVTMVEPGGEPGPALKSKSSSDTILRISPEIEPLPSFLEERGREPRTSEIFPVFGAQAAEADQPTALAEPRSASSLITISPNRETVFERSLVETSESTVKGTQARRDVESASDDDQFGESRVPWALLLLMSYSSAVTLALTWVMWTGRSFWPAGSPSATVSPADVEPAPKIESSAPVGVLPPLPADHITTLGQTTQIGDLEVTPLDVLTTPVTLVRSIDPKDWRREESASLVLRLRLKNVSQDQEFAPLETRFLREQGIALDRSTIATSQGKGINLFPLAVESEWSIEGQPLTALKPGETVESVIASEPGVSDRLTDEMIWRIRLRIGMYRTDVLGVRFNKHDIEEPPP